MVASLMLIHGLYPVDLETRVHEALETVRPYMESHGGDVELVGVVDGVAKLRLVGHCKGCPASEATLETAIRTAIEEAAPDLDGLEVEGVVEPAPTGFALPVLQERCGAADGQRQRQRRPAGVDGARGRRARGRAHRADHGRAAPTCWSPTWAGRCSPTATRAAGATSAWTPRR